MSADNFSSLIDEHVTYFLRTTMMGQQCAAQFICDCLINSIDDQKWKNLPDGQHIFYIKESLTRLLRDNTIVSINKMTKGAYLDDIIPIKRKREEMYQINYNKVIKQYSSNPNV